MTALMIKATGFCLVSITVNHTGVTVQTSATNTLLPASEPSSQSLLTVVESQISLQRPTGRFINQNQNRFYCQVGFQTEKI